jgi:hypothetical protein
MPKIHLVEGPVGAGKTTFVADLRRQHRAPALILDAWSENELRGDQGRQAKAQPIFRPARMDGSAAGNLSA